MQSVQHYRVRLRQSQRLRYRIARLLVSPLALMALGLLGVAFVVFR